MVDIQTKFVNIKIRVGSKIVGGGIPDNRSHTTGFSNGTEFPTAKARAKARLTARAKGPILGAAKADAVPAPTLYPLQPPRPSPQPTWPLPPSSRGVQVLLGRVEPAWAKSHPLHPKSRVLEPNPLHLL